MVEILEKIRSYEETYNTLLEKLASSEVSSDPEKIKEYGKKVSELEGVVNTASRYREVLTSLEDARSMLREETEEDMKKFLEDELEKNEQEKAELEKRLMIFLTPKDPNDEKNVIVEIRAGAGGDEAGLFASVLYRMYTKYAEARKWHHTILSSSTQGIGGFKEIIFEVQGKQVYSDMKYESGVHRVQRIPVTRVVG